VIFDSWPTANGWLGMILITSAGMITAWREHRQNAKTKPTRNTAMQP
jgi:drug/metabolite transporter (DMT)-like permease